MLNWCKHSSCRSQPNHPIGDKSTFCRMTAEGREIMNEWSKEERGNTMTLRNFSLFPFSVSHPLIHPCLTVSSFVLLVIDINDAEQHDPTLFFHPQSGACIFTDQCPVSFILIRHYMVYPRGPDGKLTLTRARTQTHTSVKPHFLLYLLLWLQHLWPGISRLVFSVCHRFLRECVCVGWGV